jgi:hypothetical protein
MVRPIVRTGIAVGIALLALGALGMASLAASSFPPSPFSLALEGQERGEGQGEPLVCFWSAQGPMCVDRATDIASARLDPEGLLAVLLAGPTPLERAQGLWSAIPEGTTLKGLELALGGTEGVEPARTVVVRLGMPLHALRNLDHATFEIIVHQIGWTLEPLGWRDLRIQTWDPSVGGFVPLAAFLPEIPAPRKETVLSGEEAPPLSEAYVGQPPAPGQGQPQGALSGKTVYVSAGHGWLWNGYAWRTQRPSYPQPPYVGPIIEDHNNAEAVDQYLLQYLWNAGAQVWPVRERDMNGAQRIVNNDDGTGYAEQGSWATGSLPGYDPDVPGHTYRYAASVSGAATATAIWKMTPSVDGRYAVYVWYQPGSNRVSDARYTVHHAGGKTAVTVDQRHHGLTWHYIGTYGFRAGEEARITLTNQSSAAGQVVIADAVRFGGGTFDDLTGIETAAPYPPDKPWWEVAAFYYTQRMGVDPEDYLDFNDVIARPIYARWEHAGTGDDAVYVSWHTNGFNGYQQVISGTISYVYNGEVITRPVTPGSAELRDAIHTELVHDVRAGWDPDWQDLGQRTLNLGELRELWDDDPSVRMPGALIEIAFHDHPEDTDALKEPQFELLVARAVYQGIVKYFEQRDGADLALLPEPPTHLAVQNVGAGRARASWQASPIDAVGLAGDLATGYRIYTSPDGLGWSDGVSVGAATSYTLTGLSEGGLLFVRVTATNDGGESFPTETLGVRVGDNAGTLLVNGFDRLNRTMLVPETDPVEGDNMRMFLDRMNRYDYVVQHGEVMPYPFDSANNEAVKEGAVHLSEYALVDWILGEESAPDQTLDATERALLTDFLHDGGALFLSGTEVGWHLDGQGGDPAFYNDVLRADYVGDDAGTYQVAPASGSVFAGLASFRFDAPGMYDADYPDQLAPINGSVAALTYQGGAGGTAAVQYADGCQRLVYFGFPFETIRPDQRSAVMDRALSFLDECLMLPRTTILSPRDGRWYRETPVLAGLASAAHGVTRVEVTVCRQADGLCWDGTGWASGAVWLKAAGTANWTYSLPSLEQGGYVVQARAWDGRGQTDARPAAVSFGLAADVVFLPSVMRE